MPTGGAVGNTRPPATRTDEGARSSPSVRPPRKGEEETGGTGAGLAAPRHPPVSCRKHRSVTPLRDSGRRSKVGRLPADTLADLCATSVWSACPSRGNPRCSPPSRAPARTADKPTSRSCPFPILVSRCSRRWSVRRRRCPRRFASSTSREASRAHRASRSSGRRTRWRSWCGVSAPMRKPAEELTDVRNELLLADLAVVESAVENAAKRAKGKGGPEVDALQRAKDALDAEQPLREAGLSDEELGHLKAIAPLTLKPEVVIANLEEGRGAAGRARRRGRRVRVDRGRDHRDGPGRGSSPARRVRRQRARPGTRDRGELRSARPHHLPHDRR